MPLKEPLSAIHSVRRFIFKSQFYFYKDKRCVSIKAGLLEFCTNCVWLWYTIPYSYIPPCPQLFLDLYSQIRLSCVSYGETRYIIGMTYTYASRAFRSGKPFRSLHRWNWNLTTSAGSDDRVTRNWVKPAEHIQPSFYTIWNEQSFYLHTKLLRASLIPTGIFFLGLNSTRPLYACALIFYGTEIETALSVKDKTKISHTLKFSQFFLPSVGGK